MQIQRNTHVPLRLHAKTQHGAGCGFGGIDTKRLSQI